MSELSPPDQTILFSQLVDAVDPGNDRSHTKLIAYEFGKVIFHQKFNPYNDEEQMLSSQGGSIGRDGWQFK